MNPRYRGRAITLTFDQFKYGWTNALDEDEAKRLYDTYHVAGSGIALAQMANANLNPRTESKVDTKNPDRGPLLILDGRRTTRFPGRSPTPPTSGRSATRASPRSRRCPTAATRSPSTTAGRRSRRPRSTSSSGSSRPGRASRHRSAGRRQSSALLQEVRSTRLPGPGERTLAQLRDFDIRSLVPHGQGVIFGMRENGHVAVQRMDNVGIVVDDLHGGDRVRELGLELEGREP